MNKDFFEDAVRGFEKKISYEFKNKTLIKTALTHSSYANENKRVHDNERLEFLGDSVLSLVVSDYIFKYKSRREGELSKIRSIVVCEKSLAKVAATIDLGKYIRLGRGEKATGGRRRDSILADAVEAVIAAIYLDSDIENVSKFILLWLEDEIKKTSTAKDINDYKSKLQEDVQKTNGHQLRYSVLEEEGLPHDKLFTMGVYVDDELVGIGHGKNKKQAQQNAAQDALKKLEKGKQTCDNLRG